MPSIYIEPIPYRCSKGMILRWIVENADVQAAQIGKIDVAARYAQIEVPDLQGPAIARRLHGRRIDTKPVQVWFEPEVAEGPEREHLRALRRCLAIESKADERQNLDEINRAEQSGSADTAARLTRLVVKECSGGAHGRTTVLLAKRNQTQALPRTRLRVGAPVWMSEEQDGSRSWRGLVSQVMRDRIRIAFDDFLDLSEDKRTYRLDLASSEIVVQRERVALARALAAADGRLAELRAILLGQRQGSFAPLSAITPLAPNLNDSQLEAVRFALSATDVAIVHGPPGTGKTTVAIEIIRQAVRQGHKVLACAPSNLAVDNLFEKLLAFGEKVVRIGHPARIAPQLQEHSLDAMAERHPAAKDLRKLLREANLLLSQADRYAADKKRHWEAPDLYRQARGLQAEATATEDRILDAVLDSATIVCATLHGVEADILGSRLFETLVIDEAGQSTEPATWIPIARCHRIVLTGDHCQLPPTVLSRDAAAQGLDVSMMQRLMTTHGQWISRRLDVQYRMHQHIMTFSSNEFYNGSLAAHGSAIHRRLCDELGIVADELTESAVRFIDTSGAGFVEERRDHETSILNLGEAELLVRQVRKLLRLGVPAHAIAVITPYTAQANVISQLLEDVPIDINSVDGFQGRENDAVLISLVRCNRDKEVGFLDDVRRMNVALTRARRKLIVIGDSSTISAHPFYNRLLEYFDQIGAYHGVWDEE